MPKRILIASLAVVWAAAADAQPRVAASARSSASSTSGENAASVSRPAARANAIPQVVEGPAPTEENATGMFGGDKPFTLIVDQENGELEFKFNENKEVERVIAKSGVILSSEEMTLNADRLDYDTISSKLVASGQRVVVRQGEIIATCQLFQYDPKTQESILQGNPVVYNQDKKGQVSTTRGRKIQIFTGENGTPQFKVFGGVLNTGSNGGGSAPSPAGGNRKPSSGLGGLNLGGLTGGGSSAGASAASGEAASNRIDPANPPAALRETARAAR